MSFGQFLLYLLAVWVWVALVGIWVFALVDLFFRRPDLSGWWKVVWLLVIVILPVIGTCIYLISRPPLGIIGTSGRAEAMMAERADTHPWTYGTSSAEQLRTLADLADQGKLTPEEFQAEKGKIMGPASS
jgi:hypothetical protein